MAPCAKVVVVQLDGRRHRRMQNWNEMLMSMFLLELRLVLEERIGTLLRTESKTILLD